MSKSLDEIFDEIIERKIEEALTRFFSPLEILRGYDSELFTLDEMCEIFREDKTIIRDAAKRGEIPAQFYGRQVRFPRYLIVQYLMGTWKPAKKKKVYREDFQPKNDIERLAQKFVRKIRD